MLRGLLVRQLPRRRASLCRLKAAQASHQATPEVVESVSRPAAVYRPDNACLAAWSSPGTADEWLRLPVDVEVTKGSQDRELEHL